MEELETIADLCRKHDVIVVSDEVYEWLVYPPNQHIRIGIDTQLCTVSHSMSLLPIDSNNILETVQDRVNYCYY